MRLRDKQGYRNVRFMLQWVPLLLCNEEYRAGHQKQGKARSTIPTAHRVVDRRGHTPCTN